LFDAEAGIGFLDRHIAGRFVAELGDEDGIPLDRCHGATVGDRGEGELRDDEQEPLVLCPEGTHGHLAVRHFEKRCYRAVGYSISSLDELGDGYGFRKIRSALGVTAFGANALVMEPGYDGFLHYHDTQDELYFVHQAQRGSRSTARCATSARAALSTSSRPHPGSSRTRATKTLSCS